MPEIYRFEIRKSGGTHLEEVSPFYANDNDPNALGLKITAARICRGCQYIEQCKPLISSKQWGLLKSSAAIITGEMVSEENCRPFLEGVQAPRRALQGRVALLRAVTTKIGDNKYQVKPRANPSGPQAS